MTPRRRDDGESHVVGVPAVGGSAARSTSAGDARDLTESRARSSATAGQAAVASPREIGLAVTVVAGLSTRRNSRAGLGSAVASCRIGTAVGNSEDQVRRRRPRSGGLPHEFSGHDRRLGEQHAVHHVALGHAHADERGRHHGVTVDANRQISPGAILGWSLSSRGTRVVAVTRRAQIGIPSHGRRVAIVAQADEPAWR